MVKVISPAGSVCTAEGPLLENLLASGWAKADTAQEAQQDPPAEEVSETQAPKARRTRTK